MSKLKFQETQITAITREGIPYLTARQIGECLGYSDVQEGSTDSVDLPLKARIKPNKAFLKRAKPPKNLLETASTEFIITMPMNFPKI